jgi:imidazolonepropionase-like amidohydrolase
MATAGNARIIDMEGKIGTIEKGKFADLIAVEGDPVEDLSALEKIRMVMKGGIFMKGQPA